MRRGSITGARLSATRVNNIGPVECVKGQNHRWQRHTGSSVEWVDVVCDLPKNKQTPPNRGGRGGKRGPL